MLEIDPGEIIKVAKEVFCDGIYVPSNHHPCGWDFISFEYIDKDEEDNYDVDYIFEISDISGGYYDSDHNYNCCNLRNILEQTKGKFALEMSGIDWD